MEQNNDREWRIAASGGHREMPLLQQYAKQTEQDVSHVYKLRAQELSLFFNKEHIQKPKNEGEKRESLIILEKVGHYTGLCNKIGTSVRTGIIGDEKDLDRRRKFFGQNGKILPELKSWRTIWIEEIKDPLLKILVGAGLFQILVSLFSTEPNAWLEGFSIVLAVVAISGLMTLCKNMQQKQENEIVEQVRNESIQVIRGYNGTSKTCAVSEIVVGDLIIIEAGMRVPADCLLVEGMDISCDETMYEDGTNNVKKTPSYGVEKHVENPDPFLLARSFVRAGSGKALVLAVGKLTRWSKQHPIEERKEQSDTLLQKRLEDLSEIIGNWARLAGVTIFIFMVLFIMLKIMFNVSDELLSNSSLQKLIRAFTTSIAIVIVSVPEGLPLAVSIAMAFSGKAMRKDNLLVKNNEACENLAYINNICTGKTSTLTTGEMSVKYFYFAGTSWAPADGDINHFTGIHVPTLEIIKSCIVMNNNARLEMDCVESAPDEPVYEPKGNATEVAMLKFLQQNEFPVDQMLSQRETESELECIIPFSPERKCQTTVIRPAKGSQIVRVVMKGALEVVLPKCNYQMSDVGEKKFLDVSQRNHISSELNKYAKRNGYRIFAYAYKDLDSDQWEEDQAQNNNYVDPESRVEIEKDLTFVVAFVLQDPIRENVNNAIFNLTRSEVTVRMLSGDNLDTAIYCAKQVQILQEGQEEQQYACMTGDEFEKLIGGQDYIYFENGIKKWDYNRLKQDKPQIDDIIYEINANTRVLARCSPLQKFLFVSVLQAIGRSVACTGDGLNDVDALKTAKVSFCMGSGCEAAKDASQILFLDDNFKSVYQATLWGRNFIDGIRKFLQFQLAINIVCVFIVFLGGATLGNSPFSIIQLLWINLIMDSLGAISLATEPPIVKTEEKSNIIRKADDKIINPTMWRNVLVQVVYQSLVLVIMLYSIPFWFPDSSYDLVNGNFYGSATESAPIKKHFTIMFNTFVLMNLVNMVVCRKLAWDDTQIFRHFKNNPLFLILFGLELGIQWCVIELPLLRDLFRTTSLDWSMHFVCWAFAAGSLLASYGAKKIFDDQNKFYQMFQFNFTESSAEGGQSYVMDKALGFQKFVIRKETVMNINDCHSDEENEEAESP